jgi:hypothetical protein
LRFDHGQGITVRARRPVLAVEALTAVIAVVAFAGTLVLGTFVAGTILARLRAILTRAVVTLAVFLPRTFVPGAVLAGPVVTLAILVTRPFIAGSIFPGPVVPRAVVALIVALALIAIIPLAILVAGTILPRAIIPLVISVALVAVALVAVALRALEDFLGLRFGLGHRLGGRLFFVVDVVVGAVLALGAQDVGRRPQGLHGPHRAEIVFGVLQVVLGQHPVTGRRGVPGELLVLFEDVLRGAAHLHAFGAVGIKRTVGVLLGLALASAAPAAAAIAAALALHPLEISHMSLTVLRMAATRWVLRTPIPPPRCWKKGPSPKLPLESRLIPVSATRLSGRASLGGLFTPAGGTLRRHKDAREGPNSSDLVETSMI